MNITRLPMAATNKPQPSILKAFFVLLVMLMAVSSAIFLKPTKKIADQSEQFSMESLVPKQFGQWREDNSFALLQVSHDKQALLNEIYSQNLARTYFDDKGNRIMLSIAYGGDQGDAMRVHNPEVCYFDQGYQVQNITTNNLDTGYGQLSTKRLTATKGN